MQAIHSPDHAAAFLAGLMNLEKERAPQRRVDLQPIRALLERLGHPERGLRVLHIAGSKGKGSVALLAEALLTAARLRVGTFTSPHLERWTERFRIAGREVAGETLAAAVETLRPHVEALRMGPPETQPTFFDATTAAALSLFRTQHVDCAILEVGLGGRLDSTNVVAPAVTCITSIELEHVQRLGSTLAAIAAEKAGIVKPAVPIAIGRLLPEAVDVVRERAAAQGAPLFQLGKDFAAVVECEGLDGLVLRFEEEGFACRMELPLLGRHQVDNAALALACARRLVSASEVDWRAAVARAAPDLRLPGRLEVLTRKPWIVVDCAHTAASATALAGILATIPRRRAHLVFSISADKDLVAVLSPLLVGIDELTLTRADPVRSCDPEIVAESARRLSSDVKLSVVPDPDLALRTAREKLASDDLLCAAGSVYLAGIARRLFAANQG